MLHSMTGFGRAEANLAGRQVIVEIKSLNGKGFELNTSKLSPLVRAWELDIRGLLSKRLIRGTTEVIINIKQDGAVRPASINVELAQAYYQSMKELAERLDLKPPADE